MSRIDIIEFEPEAVVVDAGDFPHEAQVLEMIDRAPRVVCCDGAVAGYVASGREPWRIVGDCDSIPESLRDRYADILVCVADQETNDQTKAVEFLAGMGMRRIAITGASGKREDHTLGNIFLLGEYLKVGLDVRIYTDHGVFVALQGDCRIASRAGMQVSVFNLTCRELRSEGLKWELRPFESLWQGTLNECTGPEIKISADGAYLMFFNIFG